MRVEGNRKTLGDICRSLVNHPNIKLSKLIDGLSIIMPSVELTQRHFKGQLIELHPELPKLLLL